MIREIILIFGRTGSGKTTLAKELIRERQRVIIVDALLEYDEGLIFYSLNEMIDYILTNKTYNDNFKYVCRFDNDIEIDYLFELCYILGNLTLVVEESEIYINPFQKVNSNFLRLVRYGRHKAVSIIAIGRRVVELSNDIRSQVNKIYSFKQVNPLDIQILRKYGFQRIENLKDYEYELVEY